MYHPKLEKQPRVVKIFYDDDALDDAFSSFKNNLNLSSFGDNFNLNINVRVSRFIFIIEFREILANQDIFSIHA